MGVNLKKSCDCVAKYFCPYSVAPRKSHPSFRKKGKICRINAEGQHPTKTLSAGFSINLSPICRYIKRVGHTPYKEEALTHSYHLLSFTRYYICNEDKITSARRHTQKSHLLLMAWDHINLRCSQFPLAQM